MSSVFRKVFISFCILFLFILYFALDFSTYSFKPQKIEYQKGKDFDYYVPLDGKSPWPKFKRNISQNSRSSVIPQNSTEKPWSFQTNQAIFASPVIDGEGTVYIGSTDNYFYAIKSNGTLKWKFLASEAIDSSALLDNKGRVYFGSRDGKIHALKQENGEKIWEFQSHTPKQLKPEGIKSYTNSFEGSIAMGKDGTLFVPNNNYVLYGIDRDTGMEKWHFASNSQAWSLPAYNPVTNQLFFGTNHFFWKNVFSVDAKSGNEIWNQVMFGTVVASPVLTSSDANAVVILGSFDGTLRAFSQKNGREVWKLETREHLYSSSAQTSDGTIIQAATDGTIYAISPESGKIKWELQTFEPIRSSPAVDGLNQIYISSENGRLLCLNVDGTLKWLYKYTEEGLTSSPALGNTSAITASENGSVSSIPYNYCLTPLGEKDQKCSRLLEQSLPKDETLLVYTTKVGTLQLDTPKLVAANQPLIFTLLVRKNGNTILSQIDKESLDVQVSNHSRTVVELSADGKFITLTPKDKWLSKEGSELTIRIKGDYLSDFWRFGFQLFNGKKVGTFDRTFRFIIPAGEELPIPFKFAENSGESATSFGVSNISIASPPILRSYKHFGFNLRSYLIGLIEKNGDKAIAWGIGAKRNPLENKIVTDSNSEIRFPLEMEYENGLLTMYVVDDLYFEFNGWELPFKSFRISSKIVSPKEKLWDKATIIAKAQTESNTALYGYFLRVIGLSDFQTGLVNISGGADFVSYDSDGSKIMEGLGEVDIIMGQDITIVKLQNSKLLKQDHSYGIILIDTDAFQPIPLNYSESTKVFADENDIITQVEIQYPQNKIKGKVKAHFIVDTHSVKSKESALFPSQQK
ncbi:MAG: PQQ-like beta-propeller repeat protein [Leptospiraceae bacterium]|nr:PQQ-like beta-propeller repeat protein [Leptospiraceae bacterium]MCP5495739.1 PQQ-like beta-propeller repeat protein [Leptospiraceae bacterium]